LAQRHFCQCSSNLQIGLGQQTLVSVQRRLPLIDIVSKTVASEKLIYLGNCLRNKNAIKFFSLAA
jgi:hypothetical protein